MQVHRTYPEHKERSFLKRNRQDILRTAFVLSGYTCLLINLLTGGIPWSLIVIGGLCVVWIAFIYRPLVENTLIKKLSDVSIVVCLYLFLLNAILHHGWSDFVVPTVLFGNLIGIGVYYLLFFKKQKRNFMPLLELTLGALISVLCTLVGFRTLNWPQIVLGSVSLGLILLVGALFPKAIIKELQKKLHV